MSIKLKLTLVTLFLGCSLVQPVHAQWAKVGKTVSKQAIKALSKNSSKSTKTITKGATQNTYRNVNNNAARSAAVASQYTTVKCSSCSGKGWYLYNGYKYQCSSCSGYGYKVKRR